MLIAALNGGTLAGFVFRQNDTPQKAKKDMVVVTAGAPVEMLYGCRPWRMDVEIAMQSSTSGRLAAIHGAALERLKDSSVMAGAAYAVGLRLERGDNVDVYYENMGGDNSETKSLRKRTITIPIEIKVQD